MPDERQPPNTRHRRHRRAASCRASELPPWLEKALVPILLVVGARLLPFFFDNGDAFIQTCTQSRSPTS